jgi:glutamine amidotransferase
LVHAQNALLARSQNDATGRRYADGWGVACYGDMCDPCSRLPELVRHKTAAFDDTKFSRPAETMYAQTVVAHVRLASVGYVGSLNSHPFTYEGWAFAHNGTLPGFDRLERQLAAEAERLQDFRLGATDSEQLFLWMLNRFRQDGIDLDSPDLPAVECSIAHAISQIDQRCRELQPEETPRLTFVLTNGRSLIGCRWHNPLHRLIRRGVHNCEICGIPHIRHNDFIDYQAVVLASQPITHEAWEEVPEESIFTVTEDFEPSVTSLSNGVKQ